MGTCPWLLTEGLKRSCDISPWDLAAECPMPPGALAGPRAVAVAVIGGAVSFQFPQVPTVLGVSTVMVQSGSDRMGAGDGLPPQVPNTEHSCLQSEPWLRTTPYDERPLVIRSSGRASLTR